MVGRRSIRALSSGLLACAFLLVASAVRAEAGLNPLGEKGQIVPFGDVSFALDLGQGAPDTDGLAHTLSFVFSPGLLYFYAPNLAIGISLDVTYEDRELETLPYTDLNLGASVGFGYHAPLSARLGLFPRLWLGAGSMRREYDLTGFAEQFSDPAFQVGATSVTEGSYLSVQLLVPLTFQLARATFLSIGPSARMKWALKEGSQTLDFGVSAGVGRYF
jgi:hypothetical protein